MGIVKEDFSFPYCQNIFSNGGDVIKHIEEHLVYINYLIFSAIIDLYNILHKPIKGYI